MSRPRVRVVLQARTSSSRLPAKVLLPLRELPLIVLAARRVSSDRHDLVVAISVEESDDHLAQLLGEAGVRVVRGSLNDVLGRFVDATADLGDEDVCIRLTGDNPVLDRRVVELLADEFIRSDVDYLKLSSRLPYGLAAAAFTVGALRRAAASATDPGDREHVTPWIRRELRSGTSAQDFGIDLDSSARCTVDTLPEYLAMAAAFARVGDPVTTPAGDLIAALGEASAATGRRTTTAPSGPDRLPGAQMSLGGAQLGLAYGRANVHGKPERASAVDLVRRAVGLGVTTIDTARAYGDSEAVLGEALVDSDTAVRVVTKVAPLADDAPLSALEASIWRSLHELRRRQLDTVLLHRASDIAADGGRRWERLQELVATGVIRRLGASIQTTDELELALRTPGVSVVQVPYHALDRRWDDLLRGIPPEIEVHIRSVFLQGLLLATDIATWPDVSDVDPAAIGAALDDFVRRFGRTSRADLCVAFVRANPAVSHVVLGVDSVDQLSANAALFEQPPLVPEQVSEIEERFADLPERLLNPALWSPA